MTSVWSRMSGGCCRSANAKVASIILIIIGIISVIAAIVVFAVFASNDSAIFGVPAIVAGVMLITEGVLGLIFANNAKNRCWMITVNVVSIIMVVISIAWLLGSLSFVGIFTALKVGCNACGPDDYCENCGISFQYVIPSLVFMVLLSAITLATSIVLIVSSCTCRRSNMDSAPI
ncbi:uncharacterized protein LOC117119862 isoform X1 [Anneissia japonica]|uniref:uncharacterized protein LOC117119862 isoform X1 n=2 Tax=Anneissia japonica TaxID=1529436 RepID=UPI00142559DD|nr:uncharacterized protein LOC117119862 isoform X1 [Anneissia japonica]